MSTTSPGSSPMAPSSARGRCPRGWTPTICRPSTKTACSRSAPRSPAPLCRAGLKSRVCPRPRKRLPERWVASSPELRLRAFFMRALRPRRRAPPQVTSRRDALIEKLAKFLRQGLVQLLQPAVGVLRRGFIVLGAVSSSKVVPRPLVVGLEARCLLEGLDRLLVLLHMAAARAGAVPHHVFFGMRKLY